MNEYQLLLIAQHRPETLERLLRVIRHRGFVVTQFTAQVDEQQQKVRLDFKVKSLRSEALLVNQLIKLYDVESVEVIA
ncbi:acetolactate synthase 2 small subunit [Volucribacter amazonae]|uniref:Acetolactate synthase n=1 Tax=Volucribacter amazonae TaxID=256731 RepID=A0A9X4SL83_9PAST|nr:acetolactate synthase 2 small subunit [Volucribacter amazonae]MDG6894793.1 acetolactate synthase [Volucribacter amazonae]